MLLDASPRTDTALAHNSHSTRTPAPTGLTAFALAAISEGRPAESDSVPNPHFQVVDLFCGAGGMSLGFEAVGTISGAWRVRLGVDINEISVSTYSANHGGRGLVADVRDYASGVRSIAADIAKVSPNAKALPLILVACAPCQGFSAHRKKHKGDEDGRNSLVKLVADIAVREGADVVVMENVPELLTGRFEAHFRGFRNVMESAGYSVVAGVVNAADFGAPQARRRALVIASRLGIPNLPSGWLGPNWHRTVRDAISDLPPVRAGESIPGDALHRSARHREATLDVIRAVPSNGGSRPSGVGPNCLDKVNGFSDVYGRLAWDRPSITVTHYARNPASGRYVHPVQDRGLTAREAARLQCFPDWYRFSGAFDDIFRQIGEAVPPNLSIAVAEAVLDHLVATNSLVNSSASS